MHPVNAPAGIEVSLSAMVQGQMRLNETTLLMSLQYVKTRRGAERIYWAERRGLGRPEVLAAAVRRMDDFDNPLRPRADLRSIGEPS